MINTPSQPDLLYLLLKAINTADRQLFVEILSTGIDVFTPYRQKLSAIELAIDRGQINFVKTMIECEEIISPMIVINLLNYAAERGQVGILEMLRPYVESVNTLDIKQGQSPLHIAVQKKHIFCIEYLLSAGADIYLQNRVGQNTLHTAASIDNHKALAIFVADISQEDLDRKDFCGRTALHIAVERGHQKCIKILRNKGADIKAVDYNNKTPLSLAIELNCLHNYSRDKVIANNYSKSLWALFDNYSNHRGLKFLNKKQPLIFSHQTFLRSQSDHSLEKSSIVSGSSSSFISAKKSHRLV